MPLRRCLAVVALALMAAGCAPGAALEGAADRLDALAHPPLPTAGGHLFEKGSFQILYGFDGSTLRLLYDGNHDGVADVQTFYGPDGNPTRAEIDSDLDGVVDRWETFGPGGLLERVGQSRQRPGIPDTWEYIAGDGFVVRRDFDDDGDGRPDRSVRVTTPLRVTPQDTDRDGRDDRWITMQDGLLLGEDVDTDGDGRADRRLVRGAGGGILRVEVDGDEDGVFEQSVPILAAPTPGTGR